MLFNTLKDLANLWDLVSPLILLSGMRLHGFSECAFRIHDMLISLYGKHGTIYIPRDMNLSESVAAAKFCRFRIANIASLSLNWEKRLRNKVASHTASKQRDHGRISTFLLISWILNDGSRGEFGTYQNSLSLSPVTGKVRPGSEMIPARTLDEILIAELLSPPNFPPRRKLRPLFRCREQSIGATIHPRIIHTHTHPYGYVIYLFCRAYIF